MNTLKKRSLSPFIGGAWSPFFYNSIELIGIERFFIEMYEDPHIPETIVEKCFQFYYEQTKNSFEQIDLGR